MSGELHKHFEVIYNQNKRDIFLYLRHMVRNEESAQDIMQETFIAFLNRYKTHPLPKTDLDCRKLLFRIARNLSINHNKLFHNRNILYQADMEQEGSYNPSITQGSGDNSLHKLVLDERTKYVKEILSLMEERYRTALLLRYIHELNLEEIGEVMDLSVSGVSRLMEKAKRHFTDQAQKLNIEPTLLFEQNE